MSDLIRVYIAGAISDPSTLQLFENIRRGIKASADLFFSKKYSPFCPFLDYQFLLVKDESQTVGIKDFYNYSLAWLEKAEAVLVLLDSDNSVGTKGEIERAMELGIPVFKSRESLDDWANGLTSLNDIKI